MAGSYIINDTKVSAQLPTGEFEVLIVAGENFKNTNDTKTPMVGIHGIKMNPDIPFVVQTGQTFKRNQTYRIRILNGQFDSVFEELHFITDCDKPLNDKTKTDAKTCKQSLTFSVIGADSAVFDRPVHNVSNITIASAERFEILIVFDGDRNGLKENTINPASNRVLLVDANVANVKNEFVLE